MATQTIDYDALAKQHGGASAVDYDALAAQHGGTAVAPEAADKSFLQRAATQPSQFSHLNPLRYFDEIGQGMAQGAEMIAHPIDTAQATYKRLTEPAGHDPSGDVSLAEGLGNTADTIAQGYGQAAAVAPIAKVAEKVPTAVDAITQHPAFQSALEAAKNITPKKAAGIVGGASAGIGAISRGHLAYAPEAAGAGAYFAGKAAETVLGTKRANAPIFKSAQPLDTMADRLAQVIADQREATAPKTAPIERDATRQNVPFAGEEEIEAPAQKPSAVNFSPSDRAQAVSLLQDALKSSTGDVVDSVVKPGGANHGQNLRTKAEVDFHLQRGDVGGAEQALDTAAKQSNPTFNTDEMFAQRQGPVPSVMEIRQRLAEAPGSPADIMETRGIQEQMRENLQRHEWSAESEARREFIARNTTGFTKTWGTQAQRDAAHAAAMASDTGDMTDLLQKSLDQARQRKAQQ